MNVRLLINSGAIVPCPPRNRRMGAWQIVGIVLFILIAARLVVAEFQINHIGF